MRDPRDRKNADPVGGPGVIEGWVGRNTQGRRTTAAVALALCGLAVGVWVWRVYVDPPDRAAMIAIDTVRYFHPAAVTLHDALRGGRLPVWNPHQMAGQPALALHIPGFLYPPNLLLMGALPPVRALEAHALLHIWLTGFFTWLLAARLGLAPAGRAAASVVAMMSGSYWLGVYMTPYLSTPAWLPAILWSVHGLVSEARLRWAVALSLFLALSFLGGYAQGFVYIVQLAALFGLAGICFVTRPERRVRVAGLAVVAGVLAFGFAAPQLLLTVELTSDAVRSFGGLPIEEASKPFFTRTMLLDGLLRGFGPGGGEGPGHGPVRWRVTLPWLGLPLILLGGLARGRRAAWAFFLAAFVVAGLFLLGQHGPVFDAYYAAVPGGDLFRGPSRAAFIYQFCGALLIGFGVHAAATLLKGRSATRVWAMPVSIALALAVGVDALARTRLEVALPQNEPLGRGAPSELVEALSGELGGPRVFVQQSGLWRPDLLYKFATLNGVYVVPDYEPSMPGAYARYFAGDATAIWHGAVSVSQRARPRLPVARRLRLDLMSVRYYAVSADAPAEVRQTVREFAGGDVRRVGEIELVERPDALPRAYVVGVARMARDPDQAARMIDDAAFAPRFEVVLEGDIPLPEREGVSADRPGVPVGSAAIIRYEATEVAIDARCDAPPCWLVLTDLDHPGWQARVDGVGRPIRRANTLYRAVRLESGRHEVVFEYRPRSLALGAAFALVSTLGVAAIGVRHVRDRYARTPRGEQAGKRGAG